MGNFVFISPNFPDNYWHFCKELKADGLNVLGIGDCPYEGLTGELKRSLTEYYRVDSLENYESVYCGVAYFIWKYGRIDWLESNNEYWLEQDARLRADFGIKSGPQVADMPRMKLKSEMRKYFAKAGLKTIRQCEATSKAACSRFVEDVGFPVIAKPDNGVGANDTYRIEDEAALEAFLRRGHEAPYVLEEYVYGEINSYDAVLDSRGEPMFETGNVTPRSLMDVVNGGGNCVFYINRDLSEDIRDAGRRTVEAFGVRSRFVHCEYFRLDRDQPAGKEGDIVALEVNMRPSGGYSPTMMNFASSTDVYKIWADMIAFDETKVTEGKRRYCAFAGRRDGRSFVYSEQDIRDVFGAGIKQVARVPDVLAPCMGNTMFVGLFDTKEEMDAFYDDVLKER